MDPQTEKEPAPHKKTPPGWLWWSLLGAGLYVLDQASKLWIIRRFPLNYLNEKLHKYAYLPDFPGFSHINADGTLDFATNGHMPEAELARLPDLNPNTVDALNKLRELEPISFLDGTMNITRVHNTGVAFGLGNGTVWSSYLFLAVPVLAIVVLVVLYRKNLFFKFSSLQANQSVGKCVMLFLADVLADNLQQIGQWHYSTAHYKVEHLFFLFSAAVACCNVFQSDGIGNFGCNPDFLSDAVYQMKR